MSALNVTPSDVAAELDNEIAAEADMPVVKHYKAREYSGMFEYRKEDEPLLIKNLILELRSRMSLQQLPGLPAYIIFMCIRHTDHMNDDEKVRALLTNTINGIKKVVKKRQDDVETISLWMTNTCRLLHNLKQYSGEKVFLADNTPKQTEHCLRNFDLSEYRQILSDLAVWIYQGIIKLMEAQIQPTIVGAVLEHEAIAGLSAGKPTGLRGRALSNSREDSRRKDASLDALMKALDQFLKVLTEHAVDTELVKQIFRQLFYFICANALNNLLLRKDMCHWSKGMQMRYNMSYLEQYNMSYLEQWVRDHKLQESGALAALQPCIQASQLLQARKTDSDVDSICEMCSQLTTSQIIKILNLYTPVNEFEERVPISFIRKIQEKLSVREALSSQALLMDTKFTFAVTFPFNPSPVALETITAPSQWGLGFLKRI
ncbi:Unconventional myosin-Va [Lamellibrachia satsuma]|nr:Unconventional myosin-Va [Lamellibrachia satsuma]